MGVVTASAIGLIVIMGTTQSFVQQRISFLALEKRMSRLETNRRGADGRQRIMGRDWDCLKTLEKIKLLDTPAPYSTEKKGFKITAVKDGAATPATVWDFSVDSDGKLTDPATKAGLESHGIDKFERLDFFYETAPKTGRIVLSSKTNLPGLLEGKNPDIVWELSGLKIENKPLDIGPPRLEAGYYVTACGSAAPSDPAKEPCGAGAEGAFHTNPDGSKGGFVENTAAVDSTAYIGPDASVCGAAQVRNKASVYGNAQVSNQAEVKEHAQVYGNAEVFGRAEIKGHARVYGNAQVYEDSLITMNARVFGNAKVYKHAEVYGNAQVSNRAQVSGYKNILGDAQVYGNAKVDGTSSISGNAKVYGNAEITDQVSVSGNAEVSGNAYLNGSANIHSDMKISRRCVVPSDCPGL